MMERVVMESELSRSLDLILHNDPRLEHSGHKTNGAVCFISQYSLDPGHMNKGLQLCKLWSIEHGERKACYGIAGLCILMHNVCFNHVRILTIIHESLVLSN